jgi:glycosyltransferase involved in cell wall biosynthesis
MSLSKNYRFAILISGMSVGGAEKSIASILPELLVMAEIDLFVFQRLPTQIKISSHTKLTIHYLGARNLSDVKQFNLLRKNLLSYDLIFSHLIWAQIWSGVMALMNKNLRKRLIWVEHNTYLNRRKITWYLLSKLGKFTKSIVSVSDEVADFFSKNTNLNSIVIPNSISVSPKNTLRTSKYNKQLRVACLGRLVVQKRLDLALNAFNIFQSMHSSEFKSSLTIIGGGPLAKDLKSQAKGVVGVEFKGFLPHNKALDELRNHDIYLNTSDYEGFCIARIEALALGLCVVSRKNAGYAQLKSILGSDSRMREIGIFFI